jgi:hypothetical protein
MRQGERPRRADEGGADPFQRDDFLADERPVESSGSGSALVEQPFLSGESARQAKERQDLEELLRAAEKVASRFDARSPWGRAGQEISQSARSTLRRRAAQHRLRVVRLPLPSPRTAENQGGPQAVDAVG